MATKSVVTDRQDGKSLTTQVGKPRGDFRTTDYSSAKGSPATSMTESLERQLIKVLVCDDDPTSRELVRTCLQQITGREIVVLETRNTKEIREALHMGRIDLLLVDSQMRGKQGTEWLTEVSKGQVSPVIMLGGSATEEVATQDFGKEALCYLPKADLSPYTLSKSINATLEKWTRLDQARADREKLQRLVTCDRLTGLPNRHTILGKLRELLNLANRYKEDFSLILLDIDHFRRVNDRYGHLTGDEVLAKIAALMRDNVRNTDIVGRYGGEEFILILPNTNFSLSWIAAERLRTTIEETKFKDSAGNAFAVTVSQGLVGWERNDDATSLICRADEALHKAKEKGRNRVQILLGPTLRDKV